ncbi:MAG TPA: hypothetical protein VNE62_10315, partial [Actinomycetota bacterium]|nr:hypothetical protein [Actinomycetota bacterium]
MIHRQANTLRRRPTVKTAAALSIFLLAMIQLAPAAAANERASGSAYQPLVCVGTYDPFSGTSECETSAVFTGTWTGHVKIHARGTADLMTGHASGVADYHLTRT